MTAPRFTLWTPPSPSQNVGVISPHAASQPVFTSYTAAPPHPGPTPPQATMYHYQQNMVPPAYHSQTISNSGAAYMTAPNGQPTGLGWTYTSAPQQPLQQAPQQIQQHQAWSNTEDDGSGNITQNYKQNTVQRFVALLQEHGPQEPSSERVLNLFLALTTHERKVVMRSGSIKAFLRDENIIRLEGNTMVLVDKLQKEQPSEDISIEEEDLYDGEELDEQQLLFEQKASSHGIHISSPPPPTSRSDSRAHTEEYIDETPDHEVYNPYVDDKWHNTTPNLYDQTRQDLEQNVADIVSWSAHDDQDFKANEPDMQVGYISRLKHIGPADPYCSPDLHYVNYGVNESIQKLQHEIIQHEEINRMASHLVDQAIKQAMKSLLAASSGDGAHNVKGKSSGELPVTNDDKDHLSDTTSTTSTTIAKPSSTKTNLSVSLSRLNPALPSFVPKAKVTSPTSADSLLSPTAQVFTPNFTARNTPSSPNSHSLNAAAQVFTPRPTPQSPVTSTQPVDVASDSALHKQSVLTSHSSKCESSKGNATPPPASAPASESSRQDSQMLQRAGQDKSVGTTHVKRRHIGLQVQVWTNADIGVNTQAYSEVPLDKCDQSTSTDIVMRNRRLQVGSPRVFVEYRDVETSTDPVEEEDDLVDTIDSLQYDEMVARAAAAEETLILTQAEMYVNDGLRILKDIEIAFMSLPVSEQRVVVNTYIQLREDLENQMSDNQELAEKNVMAIREGAWMNTLPPLSWEPPDIPQELQTKNPQTAQEKATNGKGDAQRLLAETRVNREDKASTQTSIKDTTEGQEGNLQRSGDATPSPSMSGDNSETSNPLGLDNNMADGANTEQPQTAGSDQSSVPPQGADPSKMTFLAPLLQQMMMSLARMNPALAMNPQVLQATAMQHLMSMQRAGMVPGMMAQVPGMMAQVPGMMPQVPGMMPQVPQTNGPVSAPVAAGVPMTSPAMPMMPASAPTSVNNPTSATPPVAMMMNPMMAMPGMNGMPGMPGMPQMNPVSSPSSITHPVPTASTVPDSSTTMVTAAAIPQRLAPPPQVQQTVEPAIQQQEPPGPCHTHKPTAQSQPPPPGMGAATTQSTQPPHKVVPSHSSIKPTISTHNNSSPVPKTVPQKAPSLPDRTQKPRTQPVRNDPANNVPVSEDWGDDLEYEPPLFKLDTSTVPKPVKMKSAENKKKVLSSLVRPSQGNNIGNSTLVKESPQYNTRPTPPPPQVAAPVAVAAPVPVEPELEAAAWPTLSTEKSKPTRKPLPVVGSSIDSVPVNQTTLTKKSLSSVVAGNSSSVSAQPKIVETVKAPQPKPTLADAVKTQAKKEATIKATYADELDDFGPLPIKTAQAQSNGGMAGLSDFVSNDDFFPADQSSDSWQEGSRRKKKGKLKTMTSEEKEDSNFDKLIAQMISKFPHLSRTEMVKVVMEVRAQHGTLKGVKATEIIADAHAIIKKRAPQAGPEVKVTGSILYKTAICEYWKAGTCISGDKCVYAHGKSELRAPPKHIMCTNWKKNRSCPHGDKCIFAHGEKELAKGQQSLGLKNAKMNSPRKQPASATHSNWATVTKDQKSDASGRLNNNCETETFNINDPKCVICCDRINMTWGKTLECGHQFHANCILRWIEGEERTCPTCRSHALLVEDYPLLG